ncbi:MAG: hypothetical protein KOO69_04570 [Victivallales bacterium]|nr:hypothetical protein [Victivallales bacterium]
MTVRKIFKLLPILIIAVIISIVSLNKYRFHSTVSQLQKEGFAVTPKEFISKYYKAVPANQNAAKIFKRAEKLYRKPQNNNILIIEGYVRAPWLDQKIAPPLLTPLKKYIARNIDLLEEAKQIKKYNYVRFNYAWKKYKWETTFPSSVIRDIVGVYALKTELAINENAQQKANRLLRKMFHMATFANQSPELIAQLVFYGCDTTTLKRLQRYINIFKASTEELKSFYTVIDKHEQLIAGGRDRTLKLGLTLALSAKKFVYQRIPDSTKLELFLQKFGLELICLISDSDSDIIKEIELIKKLINIPLDNYSKRKSSLQEIEKKTPDSLFLMLMLANTKYCIDTYTRTMRMIALLRCAKTACAVKLYQGKYGKLPENLKKLVPEFMKSVPIDPFDGNSLRYFHGDFKVEYSTPIIPDGKLDPERIKDIENRFNVSNKSGFYIYSVGENFKKDKSETLSRDYENKDINFIVIEK